MERESILKLAKTLVPVAQVVVQWWRNNTMVKQQTNTEEIITIPYFFSARQDETMYYEHQCNCQKLLNAIPIYREYMKPNLHFIAR